ncbi:MAG: ferric reductase-like transmembrane domain-containing protein [Candidatus Gracilibacteria bacterium]|nr:ferric reductase-like transmembrane domain-containing protein [Candidatus Gracilibacteria bacterium]
MIIKYLKYIKYVILSISLFSLFVFFDPRSYKELGSFSWFLLLVVLFIRPFRDIFPKFKIFNTIMIFRRELGILAGIFGIMHGVGYFLEKEGFTLIFSQETWTLSSYIGWGMIAGIVSLPLLFTSNNFSLKKIGFKNWKLIQRLSYLMFFFAAIHIGMIHNGENLFAMIFIIIIYIIVYVLAEKTKKNKTSV